MNPPESGTPSYPEIFLAIDNCFASKRYTEPADWTGFIRDIGIRHIEASADNECDPLYQGTAYLGRWVGKVQEACLKNGIFVCNLYSGHGTYSTLGLGHTDPEVRSRMLNQWLKPMVETAGALGAGLGFFCHAFSNPVLQDPEVYRNYLDELIRNLAETAVFAEAAGCPAIGLEQMYSPHQVPWTLGGARELIGRVSAAAGSPFYITIDTGHASGQGNFLRPHKETVLRALETGNEKIWLGPDSAWKLLEERGKTEVGRPEEVADKIMAEMERYPYLFAREEDGDTYSWMEELGCYSPIIHLQQTDGKVSGHWPFTKANNERGIIDGRKVLQAIKASFEKPQNPQVKKVDRIYLTIEVFASTGSINYYTIKELQDTVNYWRQFIPADGLRLDQLV